MKPSILKKIWSFIQEVHIETVSSSYNDELIVSLNDGRYQLCTRNAIYSYADKYDNFTKSFEQLQLESPSISKVLLLGFGLGSIPFMLEKKFGKKYSYTGVEIDEAIIYLASKYVLDELRSEVEMIEADAYSFVNQTNIQYDLICIDIFVDDKIPAIFLEEDFLVDVINILSPGGLIMFNHLAHTKKDKDTALLYFEKVFKKVFQNGVFLDVKSNLMLINDANRVKK